MGMPSLEDTSRPLLRTGSYIPFIDLQEVKLVDGIAIAGRSIVEHTWIMHLWSMLFACLLLFVFFIIPFLPGSPFRVFNPPGNRFFSLPLFLPELPLKVVNPSGCSFLPKLPFRVFNLASSFIFIFILFFHSCHRPQIVLGREPAGDLHWNGCQPMLVQACFRLNAPSCLGWFSKYTQKFNFKDVCFRHCHYQNRKKILYKALKIEWRNRVSNKSVGSNRRIGVVVSWRRDSTDLQSLENGNFIGWWYIEHSDHYSSQKFWIHRRSSFRWEWPFIGCSCPKGMVIC